jgi:tRNA wybutosine-synthesizing protein 1
MTHTLPPASAVFDDPKELIDGCEVGQRKMLSGFGGIPDDVDKKKLKEAQKPRHAAISLSGEPMLYPQIDELIKEFHRRGYTTYLVTNGTEPAKVESLSELPTQFYLSLDAPSEEVYKRTDVPLIPDGWERINKTLSIMPSLNTRRVVRLTMVDGVNMTDPEGYGRLISRAEADYVEVKAFMFVGGSRYRLTMANMPSHARVREFAGQVSKAIGYTLADEKEDSRVVLLKRG